MTVPAVELSKNLLAKLNAVLPGKNFTRRYIGVYDAEKVKDGRWFVAMSAEDIKHTRHVDFPNLSIDIAYQRALPDSSEAFPEPENNLPFLDACMEEVESVKVLFREDGQLREMDLGDCSFKSMTNQLYRPDMLYDNEIFTSVIRLEFTNETDHN